jgi:hypothetical protein
VAVLGNGQVVVRRTVAVAAGVFSVKLRVPRALRPGSYLVRLREVRADAGNSLPERAIRFRIKPPPEGVVDRAGVSGISGGPFASSLSTRPRIFASFHFAALPARGRAITTEWFHGKSRVQSATGKARAATVGSYLRRTRGNLPAGLYRCVLHAGGRVVAVASVRIR